MEYVVHLRIPDEWSEDQAHMLAERLADREVPGTVAVELWAVFPDDRPSYRLGEWNGRGDR